MRFVLTQENSCWGTDGDAFALTGRPKLNDSIASLRLFPKHRRIRLTYPSWFDRFVTGDFADFVHGLFHVFLFIIVLIRVYLPNTYYPEA